MSLFFKFLPKRIEIFLKPFQELAAQNDGVVVDHIEVGNGFFVFIDKHKRVRAQHVKRFSQLFVVSDVMLNDIQCVIIERIVTLNPGLLILFKPSITLVPFSSYFRVILMILYFA